MNDAPTDVGIKNNFGDPVRPVRGIALPVLGTTGFIDHNWTTRLSTAIGYSFMDIENSDGQASGRVQSGSLRANKPAMDTGSEFYGWR